MSLRCLRDNLILNSIKLDFVTEHFTSGYLASDGTMSSLVMLMVNGDGVVMVMVVMVVVVVDCWL